MALANRTNEKTNKELAAISEKIKRSRLSFSDLVIPIIVIVVLLVLSISVFIPMINSALEYQREIKETDNKIKQLNNLDDKLALLDENQLNDTVILAKSVIPKVLKVSDFIYYVDTLARDKSLVIRELSAGDMGGALLPSEESGAGVSGPISYIGEYTNVVSFLEEIQSVSPYIVRIQNVEVTHQNTGQWSISLIVSGYYMADKTGNVNIYRPFKAYTDYQDILDIFKTKAGNL
jgi:cell division protein FtsL